MGCIFDLPFFTRHSKEYDEQYEMLVASKPAPISLEAIPFKDDDSDMVLFNFAESDEDVVTDPETLSDQEINSYAAQLSKKASK